MRALSFALLAAVLAAPLGSADPGGPDEAAPSDPAPDPGADAQSGQDKAGDQPGNGEGKKAKGEDYVTLQSQPTPTSIQLSWVYEGKARHVESYNVLRSVNGEAPQLIAVTDSATLQYEDPEAGEAGAYEYAVEAVYPSGVAGPMSNAVYNVQTGPSESPETRTAIAPLPDFKCSWLSISPSGNPPVIVNKECLQL